MVYDTTEKSLESGQPVEVYEITLGSTIYRWTSAEDDQVVGGNTFTPEEIVRTNIVQGKEDRDNTVELVVTSSNPVAQEYITLPPATSGEVTITRFHRGDAVSTVVVWKGTIQTVTFSEQNEKAKIFCRPDLGSSRPVPRRTFTVQCPYHLYSTECTVAEGSFRHTDTVSAVSTDGKTLTVANLSGNGADWAVSGIVVFGTDKRMIISQSGDNIVLHAPFRSSPSGQSVDVQAGCDHSAATCKSKFNNLPNFGGFPFVPERDIHRDGIK